MYPAGELTDIARRKAVLCARISVGRSRCATFAGDVVRPLNWLDRAIAQWRKIPPVAKIAAVPLGLLFRRAVFPRKKMHLFGRVARFLPVVMRAIKVLNAQRR
jgi:hypothetical protein